MQTLPYLHRHCSYFISIMFGSRSSEKDMDVSPSCPHTPKTPSDPQQLWQILSDPQQSQM